MDIDGEVLGGGLVCGQFVSKSWTESEANVGIGHGGLKHPNGNFPFIQQPRVCGRCLLWALDYWLAFLTALFVCEILLDLIKGPIERIKK